MNILQLTDAELAFGEQKLLHQASLTLDSGEKIALIGRNGTGKSTLLNILNGDLELDDGLLWRASGLKISTLSQALPEALEHTIFEVVSQGLQTNNQDQGSSEVSAEDWNVEHKVSRIIDLLKLPPQQTLQASSGGLRRRTMLAKALVGEPDLLLLDEPTNHLDIPAIEALQNILESTASTLVMVSHDRALVNDVATRIIELDRGVLTSYPGDYAQYLSRKEKAEEVEATANRKFDKHLADEEVWIRQGIKARRTRNEGRARRLAGLRKDRAERLNKQGNVKLKVDSSQQSGDIVAVLDNVTFGYEKPLLSNFSAQISRGDRIGVIGANGTGKSTLIRLILGELKPASGTISTGTKLQIAYFDQQRSLLNDKLTVRDNVSPSSDHIEIAGSRKHIAGYLADFLFPASYLNMPVAKLSGGEKNRLLMAKLFAQPANLLVLDEPTNDLDVETLELFEDLLTDFKGTILLVSHDRAFIDAVATSTIVFEENGALQEYVGGYSDWQQQRNSSKSSKSVARPSATTTTTSKGKKKGSSTRLGYKEQRELDALPETIEQLEAQQETTQAQTLTSNFYQLPEEQVKATLLELKTLNEQIESAYARWEELSERSG